jgi:hypothetical protein
MAGISFVRVLLDFPIISKTLALALRPAIEAAG